jgi:hypothetical protein
MQKNDAGTKSKHKGGFISFLRRSSGLVKRESLPDYG